MNDKDTCKKRKIINYKYFLLIPLACILIGIGIAYYYILTPVSDAKTTEYLYIDKDDDIDSVSTKLAAHISNHAIYGFRTIARHTNYIENIHTGRYAIEPEENALQLLKKLKNGHQAPISIVIPEVRTMEMLAGKISKMIMADSLSLIKTLKDSAICAKYGFTTQTIPAMFIPNTYNIYWNISIEQLLKRMHNEHNSFWKKNGRAEKAEELGMTREEIATLASIIDEETAANQEKPMVAGMYINRLKKGMPLQADPTVKFAMQQFGLRRIYNSMLKTESPYNTYTNIGLPPGPIKVASVAGIDAVLNHSTHKYLYMCAKEDFSGTHNFATTYSEHLRNAARYRKALNKRNIK